MGRSVGKNSTDKILLATLKHVRPENVEKMLFHSRRVPRSTLSFEPGNDGESFIAPAVLREPARRFREHDDKACRDEDEDKLKADGENKGCAARVIAEAIVDPLGKEQSKRSQEKLQSHVSSTRVCGGSFSLPKANCRSKDTDTNPCHHAASEKIGDSPRCSLDDDPHGCSTAASENRLSPSEIGAREEGKESTDCAADVVE